MHQGEAPADDVVRVRERGVDDPEGVDGEARDEEGEGEADEEVVGQGLFGCWWGGGWLVGGLVISPTHTDGCGRSTPDSIKQEQYSVDQSNLISIPTFVRLYLRPGAGPGGVVEDLGRLEEDVRGVVDQHHQCADAPKTVLDDGDGGGGCVGVRFLCCHPCMNFVYGC